MWPGKKGSRAEEWRIGGIKLGNAQVAINHRGRVAVRCGANSGGALSGQAFSSAGSFLVVGFLLFSNAMLVRYRLLPLLLTTMFCRFLMLSG